MNLTNTSLFEQFVQGFAKHGSGYAPDFPWIPAPSTPGFNPKGVGEIAKWTPAVAAVHVGMSPYVVGSLLKRYGVTPEDFLNLGINGPIKFSVENDPQGFGVTAALLDGFEAYEPCVFRQDEPKHHVIQNALFNSRNKENWTVSRLELLDEAFKAGINTQDDFRNIDNRDLIVCNDVIPRFPNNNAVDFLTRSGLLHHAYSKKKYHLHQSWEEAVFNWYTSMNWKKPDRWGGLALHCFEKLKGEPRSQMILAINSMTPHLFDYADTTSIGYVYQDLKDKERDLGVNDILNSVVMQLNFMPQEPFTRKKNIVDTDCFDNLLDSPQSILGQVAAEMTSLAPDDFALAHFMAFSQIKTLGFLDHDCSGFDPHQLAIQVLHGYEAFSTPDGVYANNNKLEIDEVARKGAVSLISLLLRQHDFDHNAFRGLQSRSIAVLAGAGLDAARLPRMNTRDLGRVFGDDLGI